MWSVFMAFLNFKTKEEFLAIVYSDQDTVRMTDNDAQLRLIESFGFQKIKSKDSVGHSITLHGVSYSFLDQVNDTTIYISFSNPVKIGASINMINKHFLSTSKRVYHRENNQAAFISYHGSGKPFIQHYANYGKTPDITIIDGKEYSYLRTVKSSRTTKDYIFENQKWHAIQYRLNNKTMSPLQVIYYNDKFPKGSVEFHALKRLYPELARLVGYERINLNKSLTSDEMTILEMITF